MQDINDSDREREPNTSLSNRCFTAEDLAGVDTIDSVPLYWDEPVFLTPPESWEDSESESQEQQDRGKQQERERCHIPTSPVSDSNLNLGEFSISCEEMLLQMIHVRNEFIQSLALHYKQGRVLTPKQKESLTECYIQHRQSLARGFTGIDHGVTDEQWKKVCAKIGIDFDTKSSDTDKTNSNSLPFSTNNSHCSKSRLRKLLEQEGCFLVINGRIDDKKIANSRGSDIFDEGNTNTTFGDLKYVAVRKSTNKPIAVCDSLQSLYDLFWAKSYHRKNDDRA